VSTKGSCRGIIAGMHHLLLKLKFFNFEQFSVNLKALFLVKKKFIEGVCPLLLEIVQLFSPFTIFAPPSSPIDLN
jgi:hypothetical protein